jgi:hypothetical protein
MKRPTGVTVIAILHLVFGGLGLLGMLCLGGLALFFVAIVSNAPPNDPAMRDLKEIGAIYQRNVPGLVPYLLVTLVTGLIFDTLLVVAGLGLLKLRNWARSASIFYAIVSLFLAIASAGYSFAVFNPGIDKAQAELEKFMLKKTQGPGKRPGMPMGGPGASSSNPMANAVGTIFGTAIGLAYPIAILLVLFQPAVREAFRASAQRVPEESPKREDDYDTFERDQRYPY